MQLQRLVRRILAVMKYGVEDSNAVARRVPGFRIRMGQQVGSSFSALSRVVSQSAMHERQAAIAVFIAMAYGCGGGGGGLHRVGEVVHQRAVDERH